MHVEKVLWGAIVFSTFIYAGMIFMIARNPEHSFEENVRSQMTLIVYGLALASFIAGTVLPGRLRAPARMKMIIALAIYESCAVFGLIGAFVAHDWRIFIPAWVLSLIGMMRVYPSGEPEFLPPSR